MTAEELMNRLDIDGPDMPAPCEAPREMEREGDTHPAKKRYGCTGKNTRRVLAAIKGVSGFVLPPGRYVRGRVYSADGLTVRCTTTGLSPR